MNKWILKGRVVADIDEEKDVRYTTGENAMCITNFRIAVDKRFKKKDDPEAPTADFFRLTAFGRVGEFAKNYLHKGTAVLVTARIENNNYTDANGNKVFRDQYIAEEIEFCESKKAAEANGINTGNNSGNNGFTPADDGALPFK